jgi:hypothetical protein
MKLPGINTLTTRVVHLNHRAANPSELTVQKGDVVGLLDITGSRERPPDGYIKVS